MSAKRFAIALPIAAVYLLASASSALAETQPRFDLTDTALPTRFSAGKTGQLQLIATNVGGKASSGTITITDTLPPGLEPTELRTADESPETLPNPSCEPLSGQTISCSYEAPLPSGARLEVLIEVAVAPDAEGVLEDAAQVSGGNALPASASAQIPISTEPAPFDFLPGFVALLTTEDGSAATGAATHPFGLSVDAGFTTAQVPGGAPTGLGELRDIEVAFSRGTVIDPTAVAVRCTEAELVSAKCPDASQVGTITIRTVEALPSATKDRLFNMVPAPGSPATLGANILGAVGVYIHIDGELRSDGDYGISGVSRDNLALLLHPVFGTRVELWGDPTGAAHDEIRGSCQRAKVLGETCPTPETHTAMLTLPGECSGQPATTVARANTWEEPSVFKEASYESADLSGNPVTVDGCNQPQFKPTIEAQPTTNLADSPSGLDFNLRQPQDSDPEHTSTAALKDATVTLPPGLVANPSQADGLAGCSSSQIGLLTAVGQTPVHLSKQPQSCPDASKIGTLEVSSPLLAEYSGDGTKLVTDPETGRAIPRPLQGSVYLAKPFENPFGSLLAIYLVIEDPQSGTIAKLAGRVVPDPQTGQLTTVFEENPELPLEDVKLHLFPGPRAALITPLVCGTHTITSNLVPWTSPEGASAHPSSSFQTTAAPGGGSCPSSEGQAPNKPSFEAGTIAPQAGAFSPFVLKLSREDGSQRLAGIDATLPKGLAAKFAGVPYCSEAQIAQAKSREKPNEGILEQQSPSCPASSEIGTVDVAAGAGPTPIHTQGHAYLTGPYKGAPLSMVIVTPAIAGPFDLGAVVNRTALYVDPDTAQGHAVSDPLPQIIEGIPLDVRSIVVRLGRPDFTLNPTSCDPLQVTGSALSSLNQSAALSNPFQVGGCQQLPFKPKLSLRLKGGTKRASHPKLIATLKAKAGEANIASAQVKLPPSAFLDQGHIRTICTRVQFAADTCPKGSIYGAATATTPLLDNPLSGNVYLRSSSHKLPDLVVALKGPASQPIEIDLAGKTDSVKGSLRNTFEAVPDAPVSTFKLELFGGKRGLVVNSRNLCAHDYKAEVNLTGQNGKRFDTAPVVKSDCKRRQRPKGRRGRG